MAQWPPRYNMPFYDITTFPCTLKLKKAILTFLMVDRLDLLIDPTEERSIAVK
jgi:hypothetical protein